MNTSNKAVSNGIGDESIEQKAAASYTGLCPGIHISDGRGKEGTIDRCGNPRVRWILVEATWQPQYEPVRRLAEGLVKSKRAKKRLAPYRRLSIFLISNNLSWTPVLTFHGPLIPLLSHRVSNRLTKEAAGAT
jgi:hypothetical protein